MNDPGLSGIRGGSLGFSMNDSTLYSELTLTIPNLDASSFGTSMQAIDKMCFFINMILKQFKVVHFVNMITA